MAFNASFSFTGACGIVPRRNPDYSPGAFCVLLPDGWDNNPFPPPRDVRRSSVDESVLRRHMAYMYFTSEHKPDTPINSGAANIWYFNGHRVIIVPEFEGEEQAASWGSDISGLASFEDVSSLGRTDHLLDVSNAVMNPQKGKVTGQVLFKHGQLDAPPESRVWVFDSYLLKGENDFHPRTKYLNYEAVISLYNLVNIKIVIRPLYTISPDRVFEFSEGPLEVVIANLCEENPLRWGNNTAGDGLRDDEDFKWHYELVNDPVRLRDALDPARCPIPRPGNGAGAGGGLNCVPMRFSAVDFLF